MNGLKYNDNILKASAKESKSDVLSSLCSLFVVITSSLYKYCGIFKYIDKVGALIISLFVLRTGYKIIKESLSLVVGEVENDDKVISDIAGMIKMNKDIIARTIIYICYYIFFTTCILWYIHMFIYMIIYYPRIYWANMFYFMYYILLHTFFYWFFHYWSHLTTFHIWLYTWICRTTTFSVHKHFKSSLSLL